MQSQYYEETKESKHRILQTFWKIAAPNFIPAGFLQLVTVFAQVSIPLLVRQLLTILENNPNQQIVQEGLPYALLIFVASVVNAFASHRHRYLATKAGVVVRASVVSVVYQNVLQLLPRGRTGLTSGQVTNLVAVDTQKLYEVFMEGHLIWSCPLSMLLVGICLLVVLGPATLVGMLVLFIFVPVVKKIASIMGKIRHERALITDRRVETQQAMFNGIKVTKLNNYERKYQERIENSRRDELKLLRRELFVYAMTSVMTVCSPVLAAAATFITYVLVDENNILTPAKTFTVLLLFAALRFPINYVGRLIGKLGQALEAAKRIDAFLQRDSSDDEVDATQQEKNADAIVLETKDAAFGVGEKSNDVEKVNTYAFCLSGITCSLHPGEILAVVGPVGSGKSSFINGIIGEVELESGSLTTNTKRISYASQIPFILNATLQDNILFGLPYDKKLFEKVLDSCCLRPDIQQIGAAGVQTEIGERGVTLSGGQKQRISIARAAYAQSELILFDDPLSALDAGTGKQIFDRLFKSPDSPLASSAIVLVTHAAHFLNRVDTLMLVVNGEMKFQGSWNDLANFETADDDTFLAVDSIRSSVQETSDDGDGGEEDNKKPNAVGRDLKVPANQANKADGDLMKIETREHGLSSLRTWLLWFKHAGGIPFFATQVLLMIIDRCFYVATEYWLSFWTSAATESKEIFGIEFPPQTDGRSAQGRYIFVYVVIFSVSFLAVFTRSQWAVSGGARCAKNVFFVMLRRVLLAPMEYFETTPMGRIINRFTFDTEVIDITLTEAMTVLVIASSWFFAAVIIMTTIIPYMALALVPVSALYVVLLIHYRKSGADLQRIDAVTRSPIQAMLVEGLDGSATIKVFRKRNYFLEKFQAATDINSSAMLNFISAQRWLGIRIELMGAIIVLVATMLVISLNETLRLEAGIVALLIIWASNFTITLGFFVDAFGEAEAAITSIERVTSMATLPQEAATKTDPSIGLPPSWPDKGALEFQDVSIRYRDGLPLALNGLSFRVDPGKRCGVVGRTGAGKSTLTVGLFRLVEIESGRIIIDGIDVSKIGLTDLRSRLSIIPQDPFLFAGTMRECIDPFGLAKDEDILEVLQAVRLRGSSGDPKHVLEAVIEEGGANYSVGERQLLCLARALLAKPKVLIMDEATASVDGETDAFIQRMLRTRFKDTTLLTVAHRLNTIMDYDTILVMDKGRAAEFGPPLELLEQNGVFTELVNATGEESAAALREMVISRNN